MPRKRNKRSRGRTNRREAELRRLISVARQSTLTAEEAVKRFEAMHEHETNKVSVTDAYQANVWAYGAITIIADQVAKHPFIIENNGNPVESGPIFKLVEAPNTYPQQNTSTKFRTAYMTELLLNGAAMRAFTELDGFTPRGMAVFPRWKYTPETTWDNMGVERVVRWIRTSVGGGGAYINNDEIYHDALYNPYHDYEGMAPLTAAILQLNNDINLSEFASRFFINDGSTGLILHSDQFINPEQAEEAAEAWSASEGGTKNAFRVKFVGGFQPTVIKGAFDAKMQQILGALTKEAIVTGIFKIPPTVFGASQPSSGVTIGDTATEPEKESFLVNVIMPWASRHDAEFNKDVAWRFGMGYRAHTDFSNNPILETRRLDRAKAAVELIDRGVHLNRVIDWLKLELDHLPEGDEYWIERTKIPASILQKAGDKLIDLLAGDARTRSQNQYIDSIITLAQQAATKNAARAEGEANGNGQTNAERIQELMS